MESLSKSLKSGHIPIRFDPNPYLFDHRHGSQAVLPAVEALQLLGHSVQTAFARLALVDQRQARFDKFLVLDHLADGTIIDMTNHFLVEAPDTVRCTLTTKNRVGRTAISRIKEHVTVRFAPPSPSAPPPFKPAAVPDSGRFDIPAERLYRELVPFGPAYRNIVGTVSLWPGGAVAGVIAPDIDVADWVLGSPFVLDAAFHAACAWGQRYAGIVGFPVGFASRQIFREGRAQDAYRAFVQPAAANPNGDVLTFDISIYDRAENLCEAATGVCMRDVSGGKLKPPAWVMA